MYVLGANDACELWFLSGLYVDCQEKCRDRNLDSLPQLNCSRIPFIWTPFIWTEF